MNNKQSEVRIVKALSALLPEAGFITEEGSATYQDEPYCWVIDPLDGTTNYIHDEAPYCVCIALRSRTELLLGNHGAPSTTFLAGLVAAMPGIATMIAAPRFGRIGDRIGTNRMIMIGFALAFIFMLPTGFVTAVWQLIILRFMIGISDATMLPAVQTMLSKSTPREITSRIFAYNQSFQSLGAVAGPMLGTLVATYFDYNGIFMVSAALIVVNAIIFGTNTRFLRHTDDDVND